MNLLAGVIQAIQPLSDLINNVHTSEDEKSKARIELLKVQNDMYSQVLEIEKTTLQAKASIIEAEAKGNSWLQRSWRPITMLVFLALVVADSFGVLANPLADEAWTLLQLGLGGYVVGRSGEKIVNAIKDKKAL